MINSKRLDAKNNTISDAALDGLFSGVVAGVAMAAYLVAWGLTADKGPGAVLVMLAPYDRALPLIGALTHLAVAGVYGILFGLIWWGARRALRLDVPAWLAGAIYGLALVLVATMIVVPAASSPLAAIPILHFAAAHVIYGLMLGFLSERLGARPA